MIGDFVFFSSFFPLALLGNINDLLANVDDWLLTLYATMSEGANRRGAEGRRRRNSPTIIKWRHSAGKMGCARKERIDNLRPNDRSKQIFVHD